MNFKSGDKVRAQVALQDMGFDTRHPCKGKAHVRVGEIKVKTYAFHYRSGDGHMRYRHGRLEIATRVENFWVFE